MENLNEEQIVDILDKMDFFQGQRAGRELWNDKPFDVQEQDVANFSRDVALLKKYIKELTEENEKLARSCTELEQKCACVRADTVRKMQERLLEYIDVGHYREPTEKCFSELDVANIIKRIANELLEGNNG